MMGSVMVNEVLSLGVTVVLRATVLLGGAFAASLLLRRSSGLARHTLWTVTLSAALLLPALVAVGPQVGVRVPGWVGEASIGQALPAANGFQVGAVGASVAGSEIVGELRMSQVQAPGRVQADLGAYVRDDGAAPRRRMGAMTLLLLVWAGGATLVAFANSIGLFRDGPL